ncbi:PHD-finger protein 3 [Sarcoptes scabiei]|uniref:PHD-finger protein 3 n=1 Tax=Sarcoptes scabiei TaxID=52283 RepID=A0A132AKS7_SARSC|nr:PHD-finger protein 3 [Sarcoptes scabiei]
MPSKCDNCQREFHFGCLRPPVLKSPKLRGYTWCCSLCEKSGPKRSNDQRSSVTVKPDSMSRNETKSPTNHSLTTTVDKIDETLKIDANNLFHQEFLKRTIFKESLKKSQKRIAILKKKNALLKPSSLIQASSASVNSRQASSNENSENDDVLFIKEVPATTGISNVASNDDLNNVIDDIIMLEEEVVIRVPKSLNSDISISTANSANHYHNQIENNRENCTERNRAESHLKERFLNHQPSWTTSNR